jgi:hypothetical protein
MEIKALSTVVPNTKAPTTNAAEHSDVRVTITGVDAKGQMFRHPATVLLLDGRHCVFSSKSQPEIESSILAEFDYPQAHPKNRVTQAVVRSQQLELQSGLHKVTVELEIAQTAKVASHSAGGPVAVSKSAVSPTPAINAESKVNPVIELREPAAVAGLPAARQPISRGSAEVELPVAGAPRGLFPPIQPEDPAVLQTAMKSAVAAEISKQTQSLKGWLSTELERTIPATVNAKLEKLVGEAVEKQVAANSKTTLDALNTEVARQVAERVAGNQELRATLETIAKKLLEEQTKVAQAASAEVEVELTSRAGLIIASLEGSIAKMEARIKAAPAKVEEDLNARAATIINSFEESIAKMEASVQAAPAKIEEDLISRASMIVRSFEDSISEMEAMMRVAPAEIDRQISARSASILQSLETSIAEKESRMNVTQSEIAAAVNRLQGLRQEIMDGLIPAQQSIEQLRAFERDGAENMQRQLAVHFQEGTAQFEAQLQHIFADKVAQSVRELQEQIAPLCERADESVEKMGAVLQLIQGTARAQQERLSDYSKSAAANFEKEIRAVLLRLANGA